VIAVGRAPSLNENGESAPDVTALSRQLFDESPSTLVKDTSTLGEALNMAVAPDFKVDRDNEDLGFIRRKLPDADIYFVANTANHPVSRQATFATRTSSASDGMPTQARRFPYRACDRFEPCSL